MEDRLTVKELREYLLSLDSKFDNASIAIAKPGTSTIIDEEIATKNCLDVVLSPTKDKEKQAMVLLCGRETLQEIEKIYKQRRSRDYGNSE